MKAHAKRKREKEEEKSSPESLARARVTLKDLPRVLLTHSFSYVPGDDRQSLSLVCKQFYTLEKDKAAWPEAIHLRSFEHCLAQIIPRLRGKRLLSLHHIVTRCSRFGE